jgi:hypothetical protein
MIETSAKTVLGTLLLGLALMSVSVAAVLLVDPDLGKFGGPGTVTYQIAKFHWTMLREVGLL